MRTRNWSVQRKLEFYSMPEPNSGCWLWLGPIEIKGYGQVRINSRLYMAHRISYEFYVGPIPEGYQLDHLCRVRCCVNPAHLEPVTPYENFSRGISPANINKRKTICKNGHVLTEENLYIGITKNGRTTRVCRACRKVYTKTYCDKQNAIQQNT